MEFTVEHATVGDTFHCVRNRREKRFEGDSPGIEWVVAGANGDYLAHRVRDILAPHAKRTDIDKLITDARRNYIEKELTKKTDILSIGDLFDKAANKKDPKFLLQAYTAETEFYRVLNVNLAQAHLDETGSVTLQINKYCSWIVGIIAHHPCLDRFNFSGKCYRGMSINKSDLEKYKEGTRILTKSFLSSSKDRDVATNFADTSASNDKISVLCIYDVRNRRSALHLAEISMFPDEKEVLIMPYTAFKIMEVAHLYGHNVKIEAEINLKECELW
ncbi:unnamed protein product [Rotaria magnacalcarata]|uniref:NAD(P)(+)--arginine ADP-ribosyltransferase n=1 Tax=Rotaria magnacalcarata TaxID=392030 RepID=A0A814IMU5_9BILA|nr:unnamed protein product [Rotaria magnacalcarata]CAF3747590.1 unnamed protein product [Rotaria magnacalcarata]CAF3780184.1 unnamed protein product [Rotaria magnacalcarata]